MTDVAAPDSNAPAYSVSELAFALKRTLETATASCGCAAS
jgi:exodeoxyribonuclease VII large subunit